MSKTNIGIIAISLFLGLLITATFGGIASPRVFALTNIIQPIAVEPLLNFSCSSLPCVVFGPQKNQQGVELKRVEYKISISDNKFNNLPTVSLTVNQGDQIIIKIADQDKPNYYIFMPAVNVSHVFSRINQFSLLINTEHWSRGDYLIMLQDFIEPPVSLTNFRAGILRVE